MQSLFKLITISKICGIIFMIYLLNNVYPLSSIENKFPDIAFLNISTIILIFSYDNFEVILSVKIPEEFILLNIGIIILPINNLDFRINIL